MTMETAKQAADVVAASVMGLTIVKWLPPLAALFTIVWTGVRLFEWIEKRFFGKDKP